MHGGARHKLGRPDSGVLRAMTTNEAIASGLRRSGLVLGGIGEMFVIFESTGRRQWKMVDQSNQQAYVELAKYWSE